MAFPFIASGTPCDDTDHDGMPDSWETSLGLNPNDDSVGSEYTSNGYTNVEEWLNGTDPKQFVDYRKPEKNMNTLSFGIESRKQSR